MDEVKIIILDPSRWQEYKNLRLEALNDSPESFATSYEEVLKEPDTKWQKKLEEEEETGWLLFAESNGELVGMVGAYREDHKKLAHIVSIVAVFVRKEFRGKGIGRNLLTKIIENIEENPEIVKIFLDVNIEKEAAVNLYKSLGFEVVGTLKKELFVNGKYYDLYEMEKILK